MNLSALSQFAQANYNLEGSGGLSLLAIIVSVICAVPLLTVTPLIILTALARRRADDLMKQRIGTIVTQYDPPYGLSPAEVGMLYDMKADALEIRATLFDLMNRGIITFTEQSSVEVIDQGRYQDLRDYEKIAVRLYADTSHLNEAARIIPVTFTNESGVSKTIQFSLPPKRSRYAFAAAVRASLREKGYHVRSYILTFLVRAGIIGAIISLWPLLLASFPWTVNGVEYPAWSAEALGSVIPMALLFIMLLWPLYLAAGALVIWLWAKFASRYWLHSATTRKIWPTLEGYRLFIKQVDLDNIQFESAQAQHFTPVTKTLPYAMVFHLDTKWQQRLTK